MQHKLSISDILTDAENIAVIGASSKAYRTSNHIIQYLLNQNYRIFPVNPNEQVVLGQTCYSSVIDIPISASIDIMVIFRNKRHTEEMVQDILKRSEKSKNYPVIWTQLNVSSQEAETLVVESGLPYIKNHCIMVEHRTVA